MTPSQDADPSVTSVSREAPIVPARHPLRWVSAAIVLYLVGSIGYLIFANESMRWDVVGEYLFSEKILNGVKITVQLALVSMLVGIAGGTPLAVMRMSANPVLFWFSSAYVWFFRGTPLLVQLLFFFFLAALFPEIKLGLPLIGPSFASWDTNVVITPTVAAILAFGLHEAAYMAEIIRSGILSVDHGQTEAAKSIGLSRFQTLRKIVMPQAMRVIIPPMANSFATLIKATAVVLFIAIPDLMTSVQTIYAQNFLQIPLLMVACIWYLVITTVLTVLSHYLERHFRRSMSR